MRAADLSGRYLNGSAQVNGDTTRERRIMQFCLHRFQPRRRVEYQLPVYRVARIDVVEKHALRSASAIEINVRARARVVFTPAGIVNVLAGVIESLRLAADIGHGDVQGSVLAVRGVPEAIRGVVSLLGLRDRSDGELEFPVPYRSADLGSLRRGWRRVRRCRAAARHRCALAAPVRGNRDDDDQDDEPGQAQKNVPHTMALLPRRLLRRVILLLRWVIRLLLSVGLLYPGLVRHSAGHNQARRNPGLGAE